MPRLFIAIDLPEQQRRDLEVLYGGLPAGIRWTSPAQLHLTLRFIGAVDGALFRQVRNNLADLHFHPFLLQIEGVGLFSLRRQPTILWAGIRESHKLVQLHGLIEGCLAQLDLAPEKRKFHPHLTIARLPPGISPAVLAVYLDRHRHFVTSPLQIDNFRLYSSVLSGSGASHRLEATFSAS